ncbi:MAG: hypothetical protein H8E73_02695 [Planctomycetes bacterium]|nr:hypothetical protein [Planctomycetota bacterium]
MQRHLVDCGVIAVWHMKHASLILVLFCLPGLALGEILVQEDFEDESLSARDWTDIAKWGVNRSLSIAGTPEVKPISGRKCLKIRYAEGDTGGWMHIRFPKEVREVYCRYYRADRYGPKHLSGLLEDGRNLRARGHGPAEVGIRGV